MKRKKRTNIINERLIQKYRKFVSEIKVSKRRHDCIQNEARLIHNFNTSYFFARSETAASNDCNGRATINPEDLVRR